MTRLVRWLIATTDQFPLIITDSEEGCISSKQFNLIFEKLHYFEHFLFSTPSFQQRGFLFQRTEI
jgi:hypothetical protein